MTKEKRIKALSGLVPTKEQKLINYDDVVGLHSVYEIPLDWLIYNPHNGRIKAMVSSWEYANYQLDPEKPTDQILIEQFLWDSAENRNKQTKQSIKKFGQMEIGIVTQDGVIIDGNRRACILNIINREDGSAMKFRAIILPDQFHENKKQIIALETIYQMGVDNKVDYNPIEKYLRCKDLLDLGFDTFKISEMLSVSTSEIGKWLEILDLMRGYLSHYGYSGIFVGLEKREGHFVDLRQYLKSYRMGVGKDYADWQYTENDLASLSTIYGDYTRMRYPVQNCRVIANPSKAQSFFCHKNIWFEFSKDHTKIVSRIAEEDFDILVKRSKEKKVHEIIADRDELWRNEVKDDLVDNLFTYKRMLEDNIKHIQPLKTLTSAKKTIESIRIEEVVHKKDPEINSVSDEITHLIANIKAANNS